MCVTGERVRQRIHDGSLPAELVAGRWLIRAEALERAKSSSRPLSPRIAWSLLGHLGGCELDEGISKSERARVRSYAERLRAHPDAAWQLRSWLSHRAVRQLFQAPPADLPDVREHPSLLLSGVSCEAAGIVADVVEGYVRRADLDSLVDDLFLVPVDGRDANVVLHVVEGEFPSFLDQNRKKDQKKNQKNERKDEQRSSGKKIKSESSWSWLSLVAADLADYGAPRESARASELVQELIDRATR